MAAITDLTTLTAIASGDYLVVNDVSAGSDKKITQADFLGSTGTWTPDLTFGGASTGITYGTQSGSYVRIGSLVYVRFRIVLTSKGSATGAATIAGLPFAVVSSVGTNLQCGYYSNMASIVDQIVSLMNGGSTTFSLFDGGATTAAALTEANFNNTSRIDMAGIYDA